MKLPRFLTDLPAIDLPVPDSAVRTSANQSEHGLMVIFEEPDRYDLKPH